jgi:hypothetical protein
MRALLAHKLLAQGPTAKRLAVLWLFPTIAPEKVEPFGRVIWDIWVILASKALPIQAECGRIRPLRDGKSTGENRCLFRTKKSNNNL